MLTLTCFSILSLNLFLHNSIVRSSSSTSNHRISTSRQHHVPAPLNWGFLIWLPVLVQFTISNKLLLHRSPRSQSPFPRVCVSVHHHPFDLSHHTVITSSHHRCCHLSNSNSNSLSLGGHKNNFSTHINVILESQQPRNHQLSTITDSIHSGILDNESLVTRQYHLKRHNHPPEIRLIPGIVIDILGIHHIMHCNHVIILTQNTRADPSKLLHMPTNTKKQTQVNTHGPNVSTRLTRHPENNQMPISIILKQLAFVDCPDPKLSFNSRDQRRPLEHSSSERFKSSSHFSNIRDSRVKPSYTDVLFTRTLLRFHKPCGSVNTDNEISGDFRVKSSTVTSFLNTEDTLNPSNNLVRRRIRGFIEIDDTVPDIFLKRTFERGVTGADWSVVTGTDVELVVVLEEDGPLRSVDCWSETLWLDHVVSGVGGIILLLLDVLFLL
ncbi:hypothetical protein CARUB_v10017275mg [Capsella rubella]|uniref:Uncharacterized protein n=1 Tax=Capsella rubella TaxID=81985 RepID=R0FPN9_9BRAS|nr:hypothetical protein CARUB_v10017275mg [Capsella rubella]